MRTISWLLVLAVLLSVVLGGCATAAPKYPEKAVNVIVPNPPGGVNDITARALAEAIKPYFSQPWNIVNRAGGGGSIGMTELVQAKPDGYTISVGASNATLIQPNMTNLVYKGPDDYIPVIKLTNTPIVFAVLADRPWQNLKDVLDYAKANPGKFRVGSPGIGTPHHMDLEILREKTGVNLVHVPFSGGGESSTALLGGHIEGVNIPPSVILGQVKAGKIRLIATFEEKRNPVYPDVPTFKELGYDIAMGEFQLIVVPKGTPDGVVQALHDAVKKALEADSFKKYAAEGAYVIDYKGPADLKKQMENDFVFYGEIVQKLNLKQQ